MNARPQEIQASVEFNFSNSPSSIRHHNDWSFLPTAAGGLTGIAIGILLGSLLGWC
ncbi:hypothetical protein [Altericista sp. CCNU0014]|uniref:hypothetical protein n=1 Tax=Altericista sp. CCNU0014 TaxID=3082949 RepID=UPI00384FE9CA